MQLVVIPSVVIVGKSDAANRKRPERDRHVASRVVCHAINGAVSIVRSSEGTIEQRVGIEHVLLGPMPLLLATFDSIGWTAPSFNCHNWSIGVPPF